MNTWTLAVIQDDFQHSKQANLERMKEHIEKCLVEQQDTKIIVFPEAVLSGYLLDEQHIKETAEQAQGESFEYVAKIARQHSIYVVYGYFEKQLIDGQKSYYNSVNMVNPQGELVEVFRKMHLTPLEKHLFVQGNRLSVVQTEYGKIGLLICWDMAFPELSRMLEKEGVEIILAPSAWEKPYDGSYKRMASARAMDNTVFFATCNLTSDLGELQFFGQSAIYGPDGEKISSERTEEPGRFYAQVNLNRIQQLKELFYSMRSDERTDLYSVEWKGEYDEN